MEMYNLPYLLEEESQPTIFDLPSDLDLWDLDNFIFNRRCPHPCQRLTRPRARLQSGLSHIKYNQINFKVNLDVQQFKPKEVTVKVEDGFAVCNFIEEKHIECSGEPGYVLRQFTRRYKLPENVDATAITSTLSNDGVLSIVAPIKNPEVANKAIIIQAVQTNEPSIKEPQNAKESGNSAEIIQ